ncbi:MAG: hypothetical protein QNJ31_07745 [Candidatus Caenarcaniphilales bacterium]|nr:hypothetical protein [Candidatus Caenarcaniphilales bacterium]
MTDIRIGNPKPKFIVQNPSGKKFQIKDTSSKIRIQYITHSPNSELEGFVSNKYHNEGLRITRGGAPLPGTEKEYIATNAKAFGVSEEQATQWISNGDISPYKEFKRERILELVEKPARKFAKAILDTGYETYWSNAASQGPKGVYFKEGPNHYFASMKDNCIYSVTPDGRAGKIDFNNRVELNDLALPIMNLSDYAEI